LEKALADAEAVLAKVATEPQALFLKSQVLRRQGKAKEAEAALRQSAAVLNNADQDALSSFPAMLRLAGIVNASLGQNGRAVTNFEKYLQHFPRDVTSLRWRAALALRLDKPTDAVPYLERLLAINAEDVAGLNLMGMVQIRLQRFDKALPYFQQAARLAPDNASTVGGLSASYKSLGDMDSAISALSDAVSREPDNLASVIMLILAHLEDHNAEAARAVWKAANRDWQGTPLARQLSAAIYVGDGDFDNARAELQAALDQDTAFTPARLALARVELQTGHLDKAETLYKTVLAGNGDNPAAIDGMAQTALARRDFAQAVKWFRQAQDRAPENAQVTRSLIDALARKGEGRDAEALAAAFLMRHPGSVPVLDVYTGILNGSGRGKDSIELYRNAISTSAADPRYYMGLAHAQLLTGDGAGALETFQRATRMFPVSVPLYRAYVRTALGRGASSQAAQAADDLQARLPGNIDALVLKANVLTATRDADAAYKLYASVPPQDVNG
jgi:tetratricopeptide (TPR) repeat protein